MLGAEGWKTSPEKEPAKNEGSITLNQLLGIKGAAPDTDKRKGPSSLITNGLKMIGMADKWCY